MPDAVIHRRTVTVINDQGLHFRPCQLIALAAQQHPGSVVLSRGPTRADVKSPLELMTLAGARGPDLELEATGQDGELVIEKVSELFSNGFATSPAQ